MFVLIGCPYQTDRPKCGHFTLNLERGLKLGWAHFGVPISWENFFWKFSQFEYDIKDYYIRFLNTFYSI